MTFLIYFICFFAVSIITTMFRSNGIILGGLPSMALYIVAALIGGALVKAWKDNHPQDK